MSIHECSICLENLVDPRILTCGHSFCKDCLSGLRRASRRKTITCPDCRVITDLSQGVSALPINWSVRKAQEVPQLLSVASSSSDSISSSISLTCENHDVPAILYCKKCVSPFCTKCLVDHSIHIDDVGPLEDSAATYKNSLLKERKRLSNSIADCEAKVNCWLQIQSRAEIRTQAQENSIEAQISELACSLIEKGDEVVKRLHAPINEVVSKTRTLQAHMSSLSQLDATLSKLMASLEQGEGRELDWSALKTVVKNSNKYHDETHADCQPSGLNINTVDKKEIQKLFRQLFSQLEQLQTKTITILPLPFELPFEVIQQFSCTLAKYRRGQPVNWSARTLGPLKWKPLLCPAGALSTDGDSGVSFFLKVSPKGKVEGWHIRVQYKLSIENANGSRSFENASEHVFTEDSKVAGWSNVCMASRLSSASNGFLLDGKLKVSVSFVILDYWAEPGE